MNKSLNTRKRLHSFLYKVVAVLLMLTVVSWWLVCGLLAKYTVNGSSGDFATVAKMGGVSIVEYKATLETNIDTMFENNSVYALSSKTEKVTSNSYQAVSGTVIPKDISIVLDGTNDVACTLYIEVVDSSGGYIDFNMDSNCWAEIENETISTHGGKVYKYKYQISPHENLTISSIIENNSIRIKDTYTNKSDPSQNAKAVSLDFYAYLIQYD